MQEQNQPKRKKTPTVKITGMSQAAYLLMHNFVLVSGKCKPGKKKEFEFVFEDPDNRVEELLVQFISSESRKFDHAVRDIRALVNAHKS